jgi:hypothetical protein
MWIGGDAIMLVLVLALFVGVLRGRAQLDAGRWLEAARTQRFDELAPSDSNNADDDARLAAYNAYLARLGGGSGAGADTETEPAP